MSEQAASADTGATKSGNGSKKLLMLFIPGMFVQAALAYFLVIKLATPAPPQPVEARAAEGPVTKQGDVYLIEDIIVNPAGSEGRRFLNVSVALEYYDAVTAGELEARQIQVRDLLISLFTARTVQELDDITEKEEMKVEILREVNKLLRRGRVVRVYFVNFVMQ
jgi:flagellar FliL protein